MTRFMRWTLAAAALALLGACGGGGADEAPVVAPAATVPDSANASASAYTAFAATLANSETAAPLGMNAGDAPTSETEAPDLLG